MDRELMLMLLMIVLITMTSLSIYEIVTVMIVMVSIIVILQKLVRDERQQVCVSQFNLFLCLMKTPKF